MSLQALLNVELPIIQAPMAGVQDSELAIVVCNAGGLGSLPCAMLSPDAMRKELTSIRAGTTRPINVNFFCHSMPEPNAARDEAWKAVLLPYFEEFGLDQTAITSGPSRQPFSAEAADVLAEFRPEVVSFHFGLPTEDLLKRVRGWGSKILSSATTWPRHAGLKHVALTPLLPKV